MKNLNEYESVPVRVEYNGRSIIILPSLMSFSGGRWVIFAYNLESRESEEIYPPDITKWEELTQDEAEPYRLRNRK